jgi:hypothetical protein
MSIAAGIRYSNGVLLCADTEQSAWSHTLHESKIKRVDLPEARIVLAYAGHSAFSLSAIEKCEQVLRHVEPDALREELEGTLEEEYRRHVLNHPDHAIDGTLQYRMVIAFWRAGDKVRLFKTTQTAMHEVAGYDCIGSGDYLGHYIIGPHFTQWLDERKALSLSSLMLAGVKGYVEGCGGVSCFCALRDDGMVADTVSLGSPIIPPRTMVEWLEYSSKGYQYLVGQLLLRAANPALSDSDFGKNLEIFCQQIIEMRERWTAHAVHEGMILIDREGKPVPIDPKGDPSPPQPSPDSPGGSGES